MTFASFTALPVCAHVSHVDRESAQAHTGTAVCPIEGPWLTEPEPESHKKRLSWHDPI